MTGSIKYIFVYFLVFIIQLIADGFLNLGVYVHLCILPLIVIALPYKWNAALTMLAAFAIGVAADVISGGTPGVNAAAAVLAAGIRNPYYRVFMTIDRSLPEQIPSTVTEGALHYLKFLSVVTLFYMAAFLLLDSHATGTFLFYLLRLAASTAASIATCYAVNLIIAYRT